MCALNEKQMQALWRFLIEDITFPQEAIEYVKQEYYEFLKARQIMKCYVYDSGNLHQTTTSRNEGLHLAYRSKAFIIQSLTESYKLRRIHKEQWMQRLRSAAAEGRNRIPLDLANIPELRELTRRVIIFEVY